MNETQLVTFLSHISRISQIVENNRSHVTINTDEMTTPLTIDPYVEIPDFLRNVRSTIRVDTSADHISSSSYLSDSSNSENPTSPSVTGNEK